MREIIFILIVLAALVGLTAFKYRRQIAAAITFWRSIRKMQEQLRNAAPPKPIDQVKEKAQGPLVNCSKCRKWLPEANAVKLGPNVYFCSSRCLEQNVRTN